MGTGLDNVGLDLSALAARDLTTKQFRAVVLTEEGLEVVTTDGPVTGILQDAPKLGQPGRVRFTGIAKAEAGIAFLKGAYLEVDSVGRLVIAGAITSAVAQALEASQGIGAIVKVLVFPRPGSVTKATV